MNLSYDPSKPFAASREATESWWLGMPLGAVPERAILTLALDIPTADFLALLGDAHLLPSTTEYQVITGSYAGTPVVVVYHGSGPLSISVAIEELARLGVKTIVRAGNSGGLSTAVAVGDTVVVTAAVRAERMLLDYVPLEFPAVSAHSLVTSLAQSATLHASGTVHEGFVVSVATFYPGSGMPTAIGVINHEQVDRLRLWQHLGALCIDAETSTVLVLASLFRMHGGAILGIGNHLETGAGAHLTRTDSLARTALHAITRIEPPQTARTPSPKR
ncbi:hypothetical protein [Subtercola sp. RTI3]|uniref:phosphorylase family protein n=1 Tax=Subtercola sp. RTI3 TaxID=3048639 RepID=UPI002B22FCB1|nr:hypothetical protein [Subtercola sp. RTI3]MEA9984009.1 hypothetical protein [Subtercola sp. RTI3]